MFTKIYLSGEKESQTTVNRKELQEKLKKLREKLHNHALM